MTGRRAWKRCSSRRCAGRSTGWYSIIDAPSTAYLLQFTMGVIVAELYRRYPSQPALSLYLLPGALCLALAWFAIGAPVLPLAWAALTPTQVRVTRHWLAGAARTLLSSPA